jgi:hypothetical protein
MTRRNANETELKPLTSDDIASDLSPLPKSKSTSTSPGAPPPSPLSIVASGNVNRVNHWRNSPYAVGLVEPTWAGELNRSIHSNYDSDEEANGPNRECCSDATNHEMDPTCGCLSISGQVCGRLGYKRIGNMIILKESEIDNHNDDDADAEQGNMAMRRNFVCIVGPYWPMLCFVTYPLILGVSFLTAKFAIFVTNFNPVLACVWSILTCGLCFALFSVSCRDPGILPKYHTPPEGESSGKWRWNDRVQSYVPRGAMYDPDCAVVVEQFDHTCPWTGTAIGKGNMFAFQAFIGLLFTCLIMDIILLTSASVI